MTQQPRSSGSFQHPLPLQAVQPPLVGVLSNRPPDCKHAQCKHHAQSASQKAKAFPQSSQEVFLTLLSLLTTNPSLLNSSTDRMYERQGGFNVHEQIANGDKAERRCRQRLSFWAISVQCRELQCLPPPHHLTVRRSALGAQTPSSCSLGAMAVKAAQYLNCRFESPPDK